MVLRRITELGGPDPDRLGRALPVFRLAFSPWGCSVQETSIVFVSVLVQQCTAITSGHPSSL